MNYVAPHSKLRYPGSLQRIFIQYIICKCHYFFSLHKFDDFNVIRVSTLWKNMENLEFSETFFILGKKSNTLGSLLGFRKFKKKFPLIILLLYWNQSANQLNYVLKIKKNIYAYKYINLFLFIYSISLLTKYRIDSSYFYYN